jgi:hypothetical protein
MAAELVVDLRVTPPSRSVLRPYFTSMKPRGSMSEACGVEAGSHPRVDGWKEDVHEQQPVPCDIRSRAIHLHFPESNGFPGS